VANEPIIAKIKKTLQLIGNLHSHRGRYFIV